MKSVPSCARLLLLAGFSLFAGLSALARETWDDPIAVGPEAYTQRDYRQANARWERRIFVQGFHDHGRANHLYDDDAEAFIDQTHTLWMTEDKDEAAAAARVLQRKELAEQGAKLVEAGCDDPVVLYFAGRLAQQQSGTWHNAVADYERAVKRFQEMPGYPAAAAVIAGQALKALYDRGGGSNKSKALDETTVDALRRSITDGSFTAAEDYLFVQNLLGPDQEGWFKQNDEAIALWLSDVPLPDWARQTILGYLEVNRGWRVRGSGWASSVKREAWKGFAEHMMSAGEALTQAWEARPDRPEAPRLMMAVLVGGGAKRGDTLRLWFDRAIKAQFDYEPAYGEMVWLSRPRWGGSHKEMMAFGRACLATRRFDTVVPGMFARALDDSASEVEDWRTPYQDPAVADDLMTLSHGLVDEPSRRAEQPLQLSYLAVNAWMCGRPEEAGKALETLATRGGFRSAAAEKLRRFGTSQPAFLCEVSLLTGPAKEDYLAARALDEDARTEEASAAYETVLKKAGAVEPAAYLPNRRLHALALEKQLESGDWVKIDPGSNFSDWHQVSGRWAVADGVLSSERTNGEGLLLVPARVGQNFEVRGRFEVEVKAGCGDTLGIVFGYNERSHEGGDWHTCEVWQNGEGPAATATLLDGFGTSKAPRVAITLEPANTFLVQGWEGSVSYYLNGAPVLEDYEYAENHSEPQGTSGWQLGFGSQHFCAKNTTKISGVEVRRLKAPPVPPASVPDGSSKP